MWGGLFRDSHLTTLVKTWRATPGKLDWFLNPGDPRQTEDETEEYLLANYLTASRACAAALGEHGEEQVTPLQVEQYILKRAGEHAAVFDVFLGLQWANVIFMMRDSEGSGDCGHVELFQRAQRIATLLFSLCHATKYVRICTEERYHWAHASEAERFIHERYVFTKKTRHGRSIFSDRMMERFVRDIRSIEGKFWAHGKANRVAATVRSLPELLRQRSSIKTEEQRSAARSHQQSASAAQESQREEPISTTFKAAMIALKDHNVWGPCPPTAGGRLQVPLPPTHCLANESINTAFLGMMPTADARVTAYAAAYNVPDAPYYRHVERREDTPSLAKLPALQSSIEADQRFEWQCRVETNVELLEGKSAFLRGRKRLITATECTTELNAPESRALLAALPQPQRSLVPQLAGLRKLNKLQLAQMLSAFRILKQGIHPREPEPTPPPPLETAHNVQLLLTGLLAAHSFTCPTRAGADPVVRGADFGIPYDLRRTQVVRLTPITKFTKEMQEYSLTHDSGSQPSSVSVQQPFGASSSSSAPAGGTGELAGAAANEQLSASGSSSNEGDI
jgi:hypothetical protein